jgi:hypothetical protein
MKRRLNKFLNHPLGWVILGLLAIVGVSATPYLVFQLVRALTP